MSKILTVFGATGNQGGSVVAAVLRHPELSKTYKVRAVTRDTSKPSAQKLRDAGAEVVQADMNDPASLRVALKGAYAVFAVTNFWEGMHGPSEQQQGRAMADASVAEGVEFFVFSSLPHTARVTNGHLREISHFDHKAEVEDYARTLPIKSAFYWPAFFMSNFLTQFKPTANADGSFALTSVWNPDSIFPIIDIVADTGKFIEPLLLNPDKWNHKRIYGAVDFYTPEQLVTSWSKLSGKKITYNKVSDETFKASLPAPIAQEMLENMILMREYQYFGPEGKGPEGELKDSLAALVEKPTTWEDFLKKQNWAELF